MERRREGRVAEERREVAKNGLEVRDGEAVIERFLWGSWETEDLGRDGSWGRGRGGVGCATSTTLRRRQSGFVGARVVVRLSERFCEVLAVDLIQTVLVKRPLES